jgi:hypothetical protein
MPVTDELKAILWKRFGTREYPAEWDGNVYGGGKVSQRFWEYFKTLELLELDKESVVLDIGGGSPETGIGFFSTIIRERVRQVLILDPCVKEALGEGQGNVRFIRRNADFEALSEVLRAHPEVTHIACVSVFEHIDPATREGITRAIDAEFKGRSFVTTFEYHSTEQYFPHQLTARTAHRLVAPFSRFYLKSFEQSPVLAENSPDPDRVFQWRDRKRFPWQRLRRGKAPTPRWYPLALRFDRMVTS